MALSTRFQSGTIVCLNHLEINHPYPITHAECVHTDMGTTVLLTLQTEENHFVKCFVPLSFAELFTDENIHDINDAVRSFKLLFKKLGDTHQLLHIFAA